MTLKKRTAEQEVHKLLDHVLKTGESEEVRVGNRIIRIVVEISDETEEDYFPTTPEGMLRMLENADNQPISECKEWV